MFKERIEVDGEYQVGNIYKSNERYVYQDKDTGDTYCSEELDECINELKIISQKLKELNGPVESHILDGCEGDDLFDESNPFKEQITYPFPFVYKKDRYSIPTQIKYDINSAPPVCWNGILSSLLEKETENK